MIRYFPLCCAALFFTALATRADLGPEIFVEHSYNQVVVWGDPATIDVPFGLTSVRAIAAGDRFTVAVTSEGTVSAWGANAQGPLNVPMGLTNVVSVAAGVAHAVALRRDGSIVGWGSNSSGQNNVPSDLGGVRAIAAGGVFTVALRADGTVVAWGDNFYGQTNVPVGLTGVRAIAAGAYHTVALRGDGTVVAWGRSGDGEATPPIGLAQVQAIAAGDFHTVALKNDGTVVAWGNNSLGQAAVPSGLTGVQAIAARGDHSVALRNDGTVVAWGWNRDGQTTVPAGLKGVQAVAAGSTHTVALTGTTVAFGSRPVGSPGAEKTFTIKNSGTGALTVFGIQVLGGLVSDFTVNTDGLMTNLPPMGGATTFTVRFHPSAVGKRSAILRILSNDADEGNYDFSLTGTGTTTLGVFDGATAATGKERGDNVGTQDFSIDRLQIFTIENRSDTETLDLAFSKTGPNQDEFLIGGIATTRLAPGAVTTFTVTFVPGGSGERRAVVAITRTGSENNPFEINVTGTAVSIVPGELALAAVRLQTNAAGNHTLSFDIQVDQPQVFDVGCRLAQTVFARLLVDGNVVSSGWCGRPGSSFAIDNCPSALPPPCRIVMVVPEASFPQINLTKGFHQIEIRGLYADEKGPSNPPVIVTGLSFLPTVGTLTPFPITTGTGAGDGPLAQVRIVHPVALATDLSHNLYLAETTTGRIRKLSPEGIVSTIHQFESSIASGFRNFAADFAGNCYLRSTDPAKLFKIHPDGNVETLVLPMVGVADGAFNNITRRDRDIPDVAIMPDGTIYYLLKVSTDFKTAFGSLNWAILTASVAWKANLPKVEQSFQMGFYGGGDGLGPGVCGGSEIFGLFPSTGSSPILERLDIPVSRDGCSARTFTEFDSVFRYHTLGGYTVPGTGDPAKALISDGPNQYISLRDGYLQYFSRGSVRSIYGGTLASIAAFADGTLIASDGTKLLKFSPHPSEGRLRIDPLPGGLTCQITLGGIDETLYDIEVSNDLKQWSKVRSGLKGGEIYVVPLDQQPRFFRARKAGN